MAAQTRQPDQWIVVDDGKVPGEAVEGMQYIRRIPKPSDPQHTMILNMREALPLVTGDKVLIMEDDEYYAPGYIEEMAKRLDEYEVVGIARSKYYHLPTGGFLRHANMDHASLAQTGFRSSFLPEVSGMLEGNQYLDIRIWKRIGKTDTLKWGENGFTKGIRKVGAGRGLLFDDGETECGCLYVGMKGLPGRAGIGCGHREYKEYLPDNAGREVLQRWIPRDFRVYMAILEGKLNNRSSYQEICQA